MDSTVSELRFEVPCDLGAPGQAREALRDLEGIGWVLGDAMLIASEMVTYVVLRAGAGRCETLEVAIELGAEELSISVLDRGPAGPDSDPEGDPFDGIGLQLVKALAQSCEVEDADGVYRVWARLALP